MMLIAELHEVVEIGGTAIDPVPHVVHVGEFGVGATGEPAPLVTAPDLHPLGIAGVPSGPSEVEAPAIRAVC